MKNTRTMKHLSSNKQNTIEDTPSIKMTHSPNNEKKPLGSLQIQLIIKG